jgi:hypothetical protein
MIIVHREGGDLRWSTVRRRLWLNKPRDPKTGKPRDLLWLWVVPPLVLVALLDIGLGSTLDGLWVSLFPFFAEPPSFALDSVLESPAIQAQLVSAWGFLGLYIVNAAFNTFLGEEFLFRGVLLPKMEGVFDKPAIYEVRGRGTVDAGWASYWLEGFVVTHLPTGESLLTGHVADQSALLGLLAQMRDLGLPLLSVRRTDHGHMPEEDHTTWKR